MRLETGVELQRVTDRKIIQKIRRATLENDVSLQDDADGIEAGKLREVVDDADNRFVLPFDEFAQEVEHFVLGIGVEAAGHFVANQAFRAERQFQPEPDAARLPAGKRCDAFVGVRGEFGGFENGLEAAFPFGSIFQVQRQGIAEGFRDAQIRLGEGELRDESDGACEVV